MKNLLTTFLALFFLCSAAHTDVDVTVNSTSIDLDNQTGLDFDAGLRVWNYAIDPTNPFENFAAGTYDGKSFKELWLVQSALPLRAGASAMTQLWNGTIPAGTEAEPIMKMGSCNMPLPRCDEDPISLAELQNLVGTPAYYDSDYRYKDGDFMGKHGGIYSAGIFDSFCDETQFQFAVPTQQWRFSNTDVSFDQNNGGKGPMQWMALSANQEYFGTDLQLLIATGMKESWFLTTGMTVQANSHPGGMTAFHIEQGTFSDQVAQQYSAYYPHGTGFATYIGNVGEADKVTEGQMAINSALSSGVLWHSYYEALSLSSDLAWKQVLENSVTGGDRLVGFCFMSFMYNQGPGQPDAFYYMLKPDAEGGSLSTILDNPNACADIAASYSGFGDYVNTLKTNTKVLEDASKAAETDASVEILERWITLDDLQRFWFGGDAGSPGTPDMTGVQDGGLLLHYSLSTAQRQALWDDVVAAFNVQAQQWGGSKISLRYDWLSNLRVGKSHIGRTLDAGFVYFRQNLINTHSKGTVDGSGLRIDENFPFLEVSPIMATEPEGFAVDVHGVDPREFDRGIASVEWSITEDWSQFNSNKVNYLSGTPTDVHYTIDLAKSDFAALGQAGGDLHILIKDSCGNAVASKIKIEGVVYPEIDDAFIEDTDGDGNGDLITVRTSEDADATIHLSDASALRYSWPDQNTFLDGSVSLITVGEFKISDGSLTGGSADGLGGLVEIDIGAVKLEKVVRDAIGPVIRFASVQEDDPTLLYILFSENIRNLDATGSYLEYNGELRLITGVTQNGQIWAFSLAAPIDVALIDQGGSPDSVRIIPGSISDVLGNPAANNNQKVAVILDKGPLQLASEGFFYLDTDIDGRMDRIELKFAQPAVGRTGTMELRFFWPKNGRSISVQEYVISGDRLSIDPKDPTRIFYDASGDSLLQNATYFDLDKDQWGKAILSQKSLTLAVPDRSDELPMQDAMGPVIVEAIYGETSRPQIRPDTLMIKFSEAIDSSAAELFSTQLYNTKTGELFVERHAHQSPLEKKRILSQGKRLWIYYQPQNFRRPGIGDSIQIVQNASESGLIQDRVGNRAHVLNPWRMIRGTLRSQISPLGLYHTGTEDPERAKIFFFDYLTNLDSIAKENAGLGFTINFLDSASDVDRSLQNFGFSVGYFSNLGGFVDRYSQKFNCKDVSQSTSGSLPEACNPQLYPASRKVKVWVPWNYRSRGGRLVGSGVYIQQLRVWGSRIHSIGLTRSFGVIRGDDQLP